jgi:hypothetical protein
VKSESAEKAEPRKRRELMGDGQGCSTRDRSQKVTLSKSHQVFPHLSLGRQWSFLSRPHQCFFEFLVIFKRVSHLVFIVLWAYAC